MENIVGLQRSFCPHKSYLRIWLVSLFIKYVSILKSPWQTGKSSIQSKIKESLKIENNQVSEFEVLCKHGRLIGDWVSCLFRLSSKKGTGSWVGSVEDCGEDNLNQKLGWQHYKTVRMAANVGGQKCLDWTPCSVNVLEAKRMLWRFLSEKWQNEGNILGGF